MDWDIPRLERCCFCLPLRRGIIFLGYFSLIFSIVSFMGLAVSTRWKSSAFIFITGWGLTSSAVLLCILGMLTILNIILLIGCHQRDVRLLLLYNYYATAILAIGIVTLLVMLVRLESRKSCAILVALSLQLYFIILVRSQVIKLENQIYFNTMAENMIEEPMPAPSTWTPV